MRKLKVDHDQLEARVRRPQGDEHSAYTLPELTQGESHPFTDRIMEADIPLGWKPLNLERYDGTTTDPNEHLDAFLTQANVYTNDNAILCRVFPMSLKEVTLTWYNGLPPRSIGRFDTLVEHFNVQYAQYDICRSGQSTTSRC